MTQDQRHESILKLLKERDSISIEVLVSHYEVTPQTIRRDLAYLANLNKLRRHHGGASAISSIQNTAYQTRKIMDLEAKQKIAQHVVSMIPNGSSLFINIGTTTETIAKALLGHENLKVVTNNLNVAAILGVKKDFSVLIAGGEVRHRDGGIIGETTEDFIKQFRMDFGIIGISGIEENGALLDFDYREVRVAQAIIENSRKVLLAADHSKFGRYAMVKLGNISQADNFITDAQPPESILTLLNEHDVELHIAR
ncbi:MULTISPECIES: DeoR/GlpR family transcriptional regulator [unclassified Pseudoalteromonas]|uniref:DeoR/GlpR family transcriptional regulator n=1 Tax=unclassified Pseudoalteromonas TaxID=194690 RepID=UPI000464ECE5|nr:MULTISPECIES: DeoR/GlpR family transcriptional regulator [unclassified Pseudoalteromonas]MBH0062879.1 DeoR/GlpR family transcriptional regulator [Pseudoalteromonas sp. NZS71]PKH93611.1 DeoR/GlpR family transcriptional regulator [Pseudoalteromonas sp. 78C3]